MDLKLLYIYYGKRPGFIAFGQKCLNCLPLLTKYTMKAKELKIYGITLTKILLSYSILIIFILKYKILKKIYNFKDFKIYIITFMFDN